MATRDLLGRADELAAIQRMIGRARDGRSGALVLGGEPGAGKTALLARAVADAGDACVLHVSGVEAEADLSYSALHLLLSPVLAGGTVLPEPQRVALRTAFGLQSGPTPDRFLVSLAALTALAELATAQPVVCVIDDAQWLDTESADVLAFVARRIRTERIAMLFAVRENDHPARAFDGLDRLAVGGLPPEAVRQLLTTRAGTAVSDRVANLLLAGTDANPLALIELARELTAAQLSGAAPLPDPLPVGRRLEQIYQRRLRALPAATRTLLLVAASDPSGDAGLLRRAAERLGSSLAAAGPAESGHLLTLGPRLEFRHPVIRSAVYHGAPVAERRLAHEALAAVDDNADRRAWHRAAAAVGPDEELASELEQSAGRAGARGGYASRATLLSRAVELTEDRSRRPYRLLAAAQAHLGASDPAAADVLIGQALPDLLAAPDRAEGLRVQARIRFAQGRLPEAFALIMEVARTLLDHDKRAARDALFEAFEVAAWTSRQATLAAATEARRWPAIQPAEMTPADLLVDAFTARFLDGHQSAFPRYRAAIAAHLDGAPDLRGFNLASLAALEMWDVDALLALTTAWVDLARARGTVNALARALRIRALLELVRGDYISADEFNGAAAELSQFGHRPGVELLLSVTGPEDLARSTAERRIRQAAAQHEGPYGALTSELALCMLDVSLGNYATALAHGLRVLAEETVGPLYASNLPEVIEAAHRVGDESTAEAALRQLAAMASASGTPTARGLLARCRALVATEDEAEQHYRSAVALLETSPARPALARAHLMYGEWLRRRRRRREARQQLRTAYVMFEGMGAAIYARRARRELAAAGETVVGGSTERGTLTPQELEVARLAAGGAPNRDIAAQLFISPSTVEYHLRKVFRKLDVTSRAQLHAQLPSG
ncbi:ATP-binding protein [Micromonospora sp. MS34]|uniref:ATP-binding protein n=1 Tax=Micromonospora sp. MS34 TaxID=3385971 RepID=UPI0039A167EE